MNHFYLDGFQGYRSRFDDIRLVHEFLEELPVKLGLRPAMPPFLLPYYNGVVPEDAGISAFLFLAGGHVTMHTFSFRETVFFDLFSPQPFDTLLLLELLRGTFPCKLIEHGQVRRGDGAPRQKVPSLENDFGPHVFLDIEDYEGPRTLDALFGLFDRLPALIDMTPIMRPYVATSVTPDGEPVVSAMTMIAESHVSVHVYPQRNKAYFDLFSCRFFPAERVLPVIRESLPGRVVKETLTVRGADYRLLRTEHETETARTKAWLAAQP